MDTDAVIETKTTLENNSVQKRKRFKETKPLFTTDSYVLLTLLTGLWSGKHLVFPKAALF